MEDVPSQLSFDEIVQKIERRNAAERLQMSPENRAKLDAKTLGEAARSMFKHLALKIPGGQSTFDRMRATMGTYGNEREKQVAGGHYEDRVELMPTPALDSETGDVLPSVYVAAELVYEKKGVKDSYRRRIPRPADGIGRMWSGALSNFDKFATAAVTIARYRLESELNDPNYQPVDRRRGELNQAIGAMNALLDSPNGIGYRFEEDGIGLIIEPKTDES